MSEFCAVMSKGAWRPERAWLENLLAPLRGTAAGAPETALLGPAGGAILDPLGKGSADRIFADGRLLVVADAEIYNRSDLLPAGSAIGEAELVARLYRESGETWWRKVDGEYAVFIWDAEQNRGFAFTDPLGIRPLAWREDGEKVVVASRIASLAAIPGFTARIDEQAVFSYLYMSQIPTPFSIYKGVRKLESGHALELSPGGARERMAWNMRYPAGKIGDQAELERGLYERIKRSVGRQSAYGGGTEKSGSFLSGGTDSSVIAGLMRELRPDGAVDTFSIGFHQDGYDEMEYARIASRAFKTRSHEYYVTPDDVVDALPAIVRAFDEPFSNASVIPTYYCAVLAKRAGLESLLGGDGGDELFGGNSRYRDYTSDFNTQPPWMVALIRAAVAMTPSALRSHPPMRRLANYLKRRDAPLHERINAYDLSYYIDDPRKIFAGRILDAGVLETPSEVTLRYLQKAETADALDRFMYYDLKITLMDNDLRKVNRMAELAGIKARFPFLSREVVEYSGLIPVGLKVKDGRLRYLYKEAFKGLLPDAIINKTKHGFGLPVVPWMLKPGRFHELLKDTLFDGRLAARDLFAKGFVERLFKLSREDNSPYFGTYLYSVFFLELWMREHADTASPRKA